MLNSIPFARMNVRNDVLSGTTVALALVPEAVAFAFVAGVEPMVGLYGAFIVCTITGLVIVTSGVWTSGANGAVMTSTAFDAAPNGKGE